MSTQDTPADTSAQLYPLPWVRLNARLRAANGNVVAVFPSDIKAGPTTVEAFTDQIGSIVYRGDIIEQSVNAFSRRRNDWLERRMTALEAALRQAVAHWDSVISAEGDEFNNGVFDSVKDGLEDWRKLLPKAKDVTP